MDIYIAIQYVDSQYICQVMPRVLFVSNNLKNICFEIEKKI